MCSEKKTDAKTPELPSAVDDAARVILESKRKEPFVKRNQTEEKANEHKKEKIFLFVLLSILAFVMIFQNTN